MHLHFRNVNEAFVDLVEVFSQPSELQPNIVSNTSRVGEVRMFAEPITVTYSNPRERVLFNRARDCNPFFHVFESLWMLAGRNDVASLAYYNSKISDIASDDGITFNGAYGHRWRHAIFESDCVRIGDQLKVIADQLIEKPDSRRCVLQMWNVEDDLLKIDQTKDVCCNTNAYFSLRPVPPNQERWGGRSWILDMTVCNRSNDLIWGMLGANVVHFSFLQEYMAARIGATVGVYNQFSNNLHVYTAPERWKPQEWLEADEPQFSVYKMYTPPYGTPLVNDPAIFDRECAEFIDSQDRTRRWSEPFLDRVAGPMCLAYQLHKQHDYDKAIKVASIIDAIDWRKACCEWLHRRWLKWESRNA